jgi:hypothetical protein
MFLLLEDQGKTNIWIYIIDSHYAFWHSLQFACSGCVCRERFPMGFSKLFLKLKLFYLKYHFFCFNFISFYLCDPSFHQHLITLNSLILGWEHGSSGRAPAQQV